MEISKLSEKDKYHIAEFLYSYETEVLIKSDGEAVINLFKKHGVERAKTTKLEIIPILTLIKMEIDYDARKQIMSDYFAGKLG
jgi:hypothetical protein